MRDFDIQIEHYDKNNNNINIYLPKNNEKIKEIVVSTIKRVLSM